MEKNPLFPVEVLILKKKKFIPIKIDLEAGQLIDKCPISSTLAAVWAMIHIAQVHIAEGNK